MKFLVAEVSRYCFTSENVLTLALFFVDDLAFMLSTSYPRGGSNVALRAGTARDCQNWMKAIEEARLKCTEAEKNHAKQQNWGGRSSIS